jgi:predicted peptidase
MRHLFHVLMAFSAVMLINCRDEADEIQPAAAVTTPLKDTTSLSTAVSDSTEVHDSTRTSEPDTTLETKDSTGTISNSALSFTTSEYQRSKFADMPYRVMTPAGYDEKDKYPLVIFLHGIDERGTDNEKQLRWGASLFQSDSVRERHRAFVIFPQCAADHLWPDATPMQKLKGLIDNFVSHNNIDQDRIYIVGLSMGAFGTYEMVARNPTLFAAAIAISGDGDLNRIGNMTKAEWKIYAGKRDNIVTSNRSERMAKALKDHGAKVSLKVYPNANHVDSWVKAFAEPDFCSWLFSVKKTSR